MYTPSMRCKYNDAYETVIEPHDLVYLQITHFGLVTPYDDMHLATAANHYLSQCLVTISKVNWLT